MNVKKIKTAILFLATMLPVYVFSDGGGVSTEITTTLSNPLEGTSTIYELITKILEWIVKIGFPIAVLFIVYSGFLFVTAQGNEEKVTKAKNAFMWAVIGAAILLGAEVIARIIEGTITGL